MLSLHQTRLSLRVDHQARAREAQYERALREDAGGYSVRESAGAKSQRRTAARSRRPRREEEEEGGGNKSDGLPGRAIAYARTLVFHRSELLAVAKRDVASRRGGRGRDAGEGGGKALGQDPRAMRETALGDSFASLDDLRDSRERASNLPPLPSGGVSIITSSIIDNRVVEIISPRCRNPLCGFIAPPFPCFHVLSPWSALLRGAARIDKNRARAA